MIDCPRCKKPSFNLSEKFRGALYTCFLCGFMATEGEVEGGLICAGCGLYLEDDQDSLCKSCADKLAQQEIPWVE
jgi:hypothetical protein